MSGGTLPQHADIRKLAATATRLDGVVDIASFPRARETLQDSTGEITYEMTFGFNEEHIVVVQGVISGDVVVACERCLGNLIYPIQSSFTLGVVLNDEQADRLPERLEPLVLADGIVDTAMIVEDELLLCLPLVAFHAEGECPQRVGFTSQDKGFECVQERRENPFDALAALKKK